MWIVFELCHVIYTYFWNKIRAWGRCRWEVNRGRYGIHSGLWAVRFLFFLIGVHCGFPTVLPGSKCISGLYLITIFYLNVEAKTQMKQSKVKKYKTDGFFVSPGNTRCKVAWIVSRIVASLLDEHMRALMVKERPYKCELCQMRFTQSSSLNRHKKIHTGGSPP